MKKPTFEYDSVESMIDDQYDICFKYISEYYKKSSFIRGAVIRYLKTYNKMIKYQLNEFKNRPPLQNQPKIMKEDKT